MNTRFFLVAVVVFGLLDVSNAWSASRRCGLGSKIWGGSRGILSQSSEIMTNPLSSEEASVTYGTSGCRHNGNLINGSIGQNENTEEQIYYADANFEELMVDMSSGSGEYLHGFAYTLGCHEQVLPDFNDMARKSFPRIYGSEKVTPEQVVDQVKQEIRANPKLRMGCAV